MTYLNLDMVRVHKKRFFYDYYDRLFLNTYKNMKS